MKQFRDSRYWVSEDGKVYSYFPPSNWKCSKPHPGKITKERWKIRKPFLDKGGYKCITFSPTPKEPRKLAHKIHRIVAELYVPGYFEGAHVDHIDGNRTNNHYTNLQWCTPEYNLAKHTKVIFPLYSEWYK